MPKREFTTEKLALRSSLRAFLETWTERRSPKLTVAGADPEASHAKEDLLPDFVGLVSWIESRTGTNIDLH